MVTKSKKPARTKVLGAQRQTAGASHTIRIIGGQWKRTPITVIDADGLRPTPERVRETLFNWLNHLFGGNFLALSCLDMFAGSGALGFEAASRGFQRVVMMEKNRIALKNLHTVKSKLKAEQIEILSGDALLMTKAMADAGRQFDLICLDPPFQEHLLPKVLPVCLKLLSDNGLIYVESDEAVTEGMLAECGLDALLSVIREGHAGQVYYHLLEKRV